MKNNTFTYHSLITKNLEAGQALVMLLMYMMIAIIVTTSSVMLIIVNSRATDSLYQGSNAHSIAESGAETAMIKLVRNPNYAGETLPIEDGQAVITITGTNPKIIVSRGTLNNFTRSIQVVVDTSNNTITATSWTEL
jgi:hypothetical protein